MTATVTIQEAQHNITQILERLTSGEYEIIVAQGETPIARLQIVVPTESESKLQGQRVPGSAKGEFVIPPEFYEEWEYVPVSQNADKNRTIADNHLIAELNLAPTGRVPGRLKDVITIPPEYYDPIPEDIFEVFK